jgi:hypothetical protein
MAEVRRATIGFEGTMPLSVRLSEEALKGLRDALVTGEWHDLVTEDGSALIQTSKILYVTTDTSEHRVGFGL